MYLSISSRTASRGYGVVYVEVYLESDYNH